MVIAQLIFDLPATVKLMVYGELKIFAGKQFIGLFFSVVLMSKKYVKNAFRRRESPSVSDSVNSVII